VIQGTNEKDYSPQIPVKTNKLVDNEVIFRPCGSHEADAKIMETLKVGSKSILKVKLL
jgi:hypothetical protein